MKPTDIRRERLRELIEKHGAGKLAGMLGYRQPSFLSQMAGPNPNRPITEKTARNYERKLNLPEGYLDTPPESKDHHEADRGHVPSVGADTSLVADVVRLVGSICQNESVNLPPIKFADVVALAIVDTMEHGQKPRPEHITSLVRLLK